MTRMADANVELQRAWDERREHRPPQDNAQDQIVFSEEPDTSHLTQRDWDYLYKRFHSALARVGLDLSANPPRESLVSRLWRWM